MAKFVARAVAKLIAQGLRNVSLIVRINLRNAAPDLIVEYTPSVAVDLPDLLRTAVVEKALQPPANGFGIVPVLLKVEKIIDRHVEFLRDRNNRFKRGRPPCSLQVAEELGADSNLLRKLRLTQFP